MIITAKQLVDQHACEEQRQLFERLFGTAGGKVTATKVRLAARNHLSIYWAGNHLFCTRKTQSLWQKLCREADRDLSKTWLAARRKFTRTTVKARKVREKTLKTLDMRFDRTGVMTTWGEWDRATAKQLKLLMREKAAAHRFYRRAVADAFIEVAKIA